VIAYTLWHWRRAAIERRSYEERHRAFHATLDSAAPGFQWSYASRISGASWANQGGEAYEDRYLVDGWETLARLEVAAITGSRQAAHTRIAASVNSAVAGIYGVRLGSPIMGPRHAWWFPKPDGMSYAELDDLLAPHASQGVLWVRRMVLGPTPEFCFEATSPVQLPSRLRSSPVLHEPLWPT
jgi:hypothetical protein